MFADGVPGFPNSAGINSEKLAAQMLETIGNHYAVFLKGHGIVVSEQSGEGNAVSAIRLERAARDQILLLSFSQPKPLTDGVRGRIRSRIDHPYRIWILSAPATFPKNFSFHILRSKLRYRIASIAVKIQPGRV